MTLGKLVLAAATAMALAACQQSASTGDNRSFAGVGGSPSGVPIVLESIDGPPGPVQNAFRTQLTDAAASRKVDLVTAATPARYRVRGYLSTEETSGGETSVAYVWDVFDAQKKRAQRLVGSSRVRAATSQGWSEFDTETLAELAGASMDEIAGFLSASKSREVVTAQAPADGQAVSAE
jgi:hypothetical protein